MTGPNTHTHLFRTSSLPRPCRTQPPRANHHPPHPPRVPIRRRHSSGKTTTRPFHPPLPLRIQHPPLASFPSGLPLPCPCKIISHPLSPTPIFKKTTEEGKKPRANNYAFPPPFQAQRAASWEQWVADLYQQTNEIESIHKLAPAEFITWVPSEDRKRELTASGLEDILGHLSGTHVNICHGLNVIEGGLRFAALCGEAVGLVHGEETAGMSGGAGLRPGQRAMLEERIRGSLVRCEGVRDRFVEMGERHRGHIGQVSCVCRAIIQGLVVVRVRGHGVAGAV